MAHLYPRLHLQHGLLLLVLEVDGFFLYYPELALLLCIPCQNLLKIFNVTPSLTVKFVKHKYIIAARFTIFMYILLSVISFHCIIFVKPSVFNQGNLRFPCFNYSYTLQAVRKVSVSYLYSLIPTIGVMCYSKTTKREITHIEY